MKTVKIKDLGRTVTGHTPPTSESKYFGDYMPFVKPTDIDKESKFTYNPEQYYSEEAAEKYKTSLIPKGATCVVCIGTIGEKMTMAHCDLYTNQSINSIIPSKDYDPDYVYYLLKYNLGKVKALNKGTASGREFVSKSTFLEMDVEAHEDLATQQRIGSMLSAYDSLVENNRRQIDLLDEATRRIYNNLTASYQSDFAGPDLGATPSDGFRFVKIGDVFTTLLGGTPSRERKDFWEGGTISWINSGAVNKLRIVEPSECITEAALQKSATKLLPTHTTILAITGATLGQVSFTEIETCANQSVVGIVDPTGIYTYFMYLFVSENIKKIIAKATGGAQQHINKDIVNSYTVCLPPEEIMEDFNKMVIPYFEKIAQLSKQNLGLIESRDILIQKIMSGESLIK